MLSGDNTGGIRYQWRYSSTPCPTEFTCCEPGMKQDCAELSDAIRWCYLVLSDIDLEISGFSRGCQDMVACLVSTSITSMIMTKTTFHCSDNQQLNSSDSKTCIAGWEIFPKFGRHAKLFFLTIIISRWIEHNQDMVNAIIAESTLDCIVSSYRLRAPYKGQLASKYGRAENG